MPARDHVVPEKRPADPFRLFVLAGVWLALFALLFTLGDSLGAWPQVPPASLRGTDLAVGAAVGVLLLGLLLRAIVRGSE